MRHILGKGMIDVKGEKVCSKREHDLRLARVYGYEQDSASYTRLIIESRVRKNLLDEQWRNGWHMKQSGIPKAA